MLHTGLDLGRRKIDVCLLSSEGEIVDEWASARCHPETRHDIARRRSEGKSTREAIRCLKRYPARRVWRLLQPPTPSGKSLNLLT